jgi:hypothetical protein
MDYRHKIVPETSYYYTFIFVAGMGDMRNAYKTLVGNPERRDQSEDIGVNGKCALRKGWEGEYWTGTSGGLL